MTKDKKRKAGKRSGGKGANVKQTKRPGKPAQKPGSKQTQSAKPGKRIEAPYPHFRLYNKSEHPTLIVGDQIFVIEDKDVEEYLYRKVMHAEKDGRHLNEKVVPNPNPADKKPMYIAKRVRHDDKAHFSKKPLPWKYPKKDK